MNEARLIEILGKDRYEEMQRLSRAQSDMVKGIIESLPPGVKIKNVMVGTEEDDFINNNMTFIIKFKI